MAPPTLCSCVSPRAGQTWECLCVCESIHMCVCVCVCARACTLFYFGVLGGFQLCMSVDCLCLASTNKHSKLPFSTRLICWFGRILYYFCNIYLHHSHKTQLQMILCKHMCMHVKINTYTQEQHTAHTHTHTHTQNTHKPTQRHVCAHTSMPTHTYTHAHTHTHVPSSHPKPSWWPSPILPPGLH